MLRLAACLFALTMTAPASAQPAKQEPDIRYHLIQLSIALPPGTSEDDRARRAEAFRADVERTKNCEQPQLTAQALGAEHAINRSIGSRELPPQISVQLADLPIGGMLRTMISPERISVLVICGRTRVETPSSPETPMH